MRARRLPPASAPTSPARSEEPSNAVLAVTSAMVTSASFRSLRRKASSSTIARQLVLRGVLKATS